MPEPLKIAEPRELVGRLVRQIWVEWAREQPNPKPSWLLPWEELDDGQREVDMRIGAALFDAGRRAGGDAQAAVAAAWKFAEEMRSYCSPHGVAADYADRLEERLRDAESPASASSGPSESPAVHGEARETQEG